VDLPEPVTVGVAASAAPFAADTGLGDDGLDMAPVSVDTTPDFDEPEPAATERDVPSDLDNDPNTPQ
jgi:hypothetical protein